MQPVVVEPVDVFEDRELELSARAPDAVVDQLRLERVDEALSQGVDAPMVVNYRFRVMPKPGLPHVMVTLPRGGSGRVGGSNADVDGAVDSGTPVR